MGPIWELVCELHQVSAHSPIVMHSWCLDGAGGEGEATSLLSFLGGYWGKNHKQHPLKVNALG